MFLKVSEREELQPAKPSNISQYPLQFQTSEHREKHLGGVLPQCLGESIFGETMGLRFSSAMVLGVWDVFLMLCLAGSMSLKRLLHVPHVPGEFSDKLGEFTVLRSSRATTALAIWSEEFTQCLPNSHFFKRNNHQRPIHAKVRSLKQLTLGKISILGDLSGFMERITTVLYILHLGNAHRELFDIF